MRYSLPAGEYAAWREAHSRPRQRSVRLAAVRIEGTERVSKDYVRNEHGAGGVYVWDSRAAAQAWFTEDKLKEYTQVFGARPTLTWYDANLTVDNKAGQTRVNGQPVAEA